MKKKLTEAQLRNIIEEAVMNEIMTGGYMNPKFNEGLTGPSVEDFRSDISQMLYGYIKEHENKGNIRFDDELRQSWRDAVNGLAQAMFKSKQTKEFRDFRGFDE